MPECDTAGSPPSRNRAGGRAEDSSTVPEAGATLTPVSVPTVPPAPPAPARRDARRALFALALAAAAAATLSSAASCSGSCPARRAPARPVILVTVDALRADRVGLYGGPLATPHMDRVGREGAVARHAVAPFGRTTQSVGSLLTGQHPLRHGADGLGMVLPAKVQTLAEAYKAAGYDTAAFISNIVLQPGFGFEQGFDVFSNPPARWVGNSGFAIADEALAWVERHANADVGARPFFLWVHVLEPHWPYEPREPYARRAAPGFAGYSDLPRRIDAGEVSWGTLLFDAPALLKPGEIDFLRRMYDGEVLEADDVVGRLLGGLEKLKVLDDAIVVLTADHGESLGEHDYWFGHGEYLYEPTLRVPLCVRAPGLVPAGTALDGTVQLADLFPTLLDLSAIAVPEGLDGTSLATLLKGGGSVPDRPAIQLTDHLLVRRENPRRAVPGREGRWWAAREGALKLIRIPTAPGAFAEELYDLRADPGETRNLAAERAADLARLRGRLLDAARPLVAVAPTDEHDAPEIDAEAMKGLGYTR